MPPGGPGSCFGLTIGIGGGRCDRPVMGSILGRLLTTGIMLARSLDRSGPDGGRIGPGAGPAEKVGIVDVEDDGAGPLGNVDDELVLLKSGSGFFGSAGPVEVDAIAILPDPEAGSGVGFELEFFWSDANICPTYWTAFSISSRFDRSTLSSLL